MARRVAHPPGVAEWFTLPDGDDIRLWWCGGSGEPLVVLLHGLEGSANSNYIRGLAHQLALRNWRVVVMHFRGCAGIPNRRDRGYHSGDTGDIDALIQSLKARWPQAPLFVVGFSLGGNMLLKWLGEKGEAAPINAACAISVPFLLDRCADQMGRGFSRFYQWWLVRSMRASVTAKFAGRTDPPIKFDHLTDTSSFWEFDDAVTAPLHGFDGVKDYYTRSSSRQFLKNIARPTLIVHSRDDPFMTPDVIPSPDEVSPSVELQITKRGGHVGFISGSMPGRHRYWLEERIPSFFTPHLWISP